MITGKTNCYAIIGKPIGHSLSPVMHNIFFNSLRINSVYIPLEVQEGNVEEAIQGLFALGFQGANVTIPYKSVVIPYLSGISAQAELIGAVNTLVREKNGFRGENTDGQGLLQALWQEKKWQPQGKRGVILGAGGSAKAVAVSLALAGIEQIVIINRSLSRANAIAELISSRIGVATQTFGWQTPQLAKIIANSDVIINTTPLGMEPNVNEKPPINPTYLTKGQLVVDLIYNPRETLFLQQAHEQGCDIYNGLGMLIYQGLLAFKLWTGREPAVTGIKEKLEMHL